MNDEDIENAIGKIGRTIGEYLGGFLRDLGEAARALSVTSKPAGVSPEGRSRFEVTEGPGEAEANIEAANVKATNVKAANVESDAVSALRGWWEQTAHDEVAQLVAKMTEYGGLSRATDLTAIGQDLVAAGISGGGPMDGPVSDSWLQELGIYFYVRGKFARWQAAIIEGRPVSDDTLMDIGIYVRMAQRVRAAGGWPV